MDKEWVALIGVVAGGIMAGGFSILSNHISFSRQQRHQIREQHLQHIEEVFDCLDKVGNAISYFHTNYMVSLLQGKTDPPLNILELPLARLELLVKLYCPELKPLFLRLKEQKKTCSDHFLEAVKYLAMKNNQEKLTEIRALADALKQFMDLCEQLKTQVISLANK
ncbi:MAG TPA: hypothetical protein VGH42_07355 [Verrucomicrobiae bacterium]|jgi:hypothetical protein